MAEENLRSFARPAHAVISDAIIAALGYTPAAAGVMADGTAAAPGLAFASAADTGFHKYIDSSSGKGLAFAVAGKRVGSIDYRTIGALPFDNVRFRLGTGQAITATDTDTFVATIETPSVNISGALSRVAFFNMGSIALTATDAVTKTEQQAMFELDKIDLMADAGAVVFDDVVGIRVRTAVPHDDVTVTRATCIELPYVQTLGTGAITDVVGIRFVSGVVPGVTNTCGILFATEPNLGSIASEAGEDIFINAGISSSGNLNLGVQSKLVLRIADVGANGNFLKASANNTPLLKADHASAANVALTLSSKGTSSVSILTGGGQQLEVIDRASAVNRASVRGGAAGAGVTFGAVGESNIDVLLSPAGTGVLRFGTHSSIVAETVTGYITIKDSAGTTRKLAVVS
jgi:hypothetical protein